MPEFFASSAKGLSEALQKELIEIGIEKTRLTATGVFFESNWEGCYRVNLWSRVASRVLRPISDFTAYQEDELYGQTLNFDFTRVFSNTQSFRVDASVVDCKIYDQRVVAMKIKDAIADQFREKTGERPNVDRVNPDVRVYVRAIRNQFSLAIDTTGESLFKRGYRRESGEAPLRENLAAGLLVLSGWDRKSPLIDPLCGSGTFLIEGALMALNIAPGTLRRSFGFQRLKGFQKEVWEKLVDEAISAEKKELSFKFYGSDMDRKVLQIAKTNAERAGVAEFIEFKREPVSTWTPPLIGTSEDSMIVTNPPFGYRLGEEDNLKDVYRDLGFSLKTNCQGKTAWILSGNKDLTMELKMKNSSRIFVANGPIECRWLKYDIRAR